MHNSHFPVDLIPRRLQCTILDTMKQYHLSVKSISRAECVISCLLSLHCLCSISYQRRPCTCNRSRKRNIMNISPASRSQWRKCHFYSNEVINSHWITFSSTTNNPFDLHAETGDDIYNHKMLVFWQQESHILFASLGRFRMDPVRFCTLSLHGSSYDIYEVDGVRDDKSHIRRMKDEDWWPGKGWGSDRYGKILLIILIYWNRSKRVWNCIWLPETRLERYWF